MLETHNKYTCESNAPRHESPFRIAYWDLCKCHGCHLFIQLLSFRTAIEIGIITRSLATNWRVISCQIVKVLYILSTIAEAILSRHFPSVCLRKNTVDDFPFALWVPVNDANVHNGESCCCNFPFQWVKNVNHGKSLWVGCSCWGRIICCWVEQKYSDTNIFFQKKVNWYELSFGSCTYLRIIVAD